MTPDALLRPVGPLPASVYWRRRAVVVIGAVVVLVVLRSLLSGGGGGAPHRVAVAPHVTSTPTARPVVASPAPTPTPTPATTATPSASAAPASGACTDSQLSMSVTADAASYPAGVAPRFVVSLTASGMTPCTVDLASLAVTVHSGPDRIWSSTDCRTASRSPATVRPGTPLTQTVIWQRRRSNPDQCAAALPATQSGTYRADAALGGVGAPAPAVFSLA